MTDIEKKDFRESWTKYIQEHIEINSKQYVEDIKSFDIAMFTIASASIPSILLIFSKIDCLSMDQISYLKQAAMYSSWVIIIYLSILILSILMGKNKISLLENSFVNVRDSNVNQVEIQAEKENDKISKYENKIIKYFRIIVEIIGRVFMITFFILSLNAVKNTIFLMQPCQKADLNVSIGNIRNNIPINNENNTTYVSKANNIKYENSSKNINKSTESHIKCIKNEKLMDDVNCSFDINISINPKV